MKDKDQKALLLPCAFADKEEGQCIETWRHCQNSWPWLTHEGRGAVFSLWGKYSSDPSLSLSYLPVISKWALQCGIQSHWITPSHSNCLNKSLLFTVRKCRWEMYSAANSLHHICTQHCMSAERSHLHQLQLSQAGLASCQGQMKAATWPQDRPASQDGCSKTTWIAQHRAHGANWHCVLLLSFVLPQKKRFSWFQFHHRWLMLMAKHSWDQDLCNQQELEHCQLPGPGTPKAIHHPHH